MTEPNDKQRRTSIEALAARIAGEIVAELYRPGETTATLSRRRVESALQDAAARAVAEWLATG